MHGSEILRFANVCKTRGAPLTGINFALQRGQLACVVGPSGAGKSTLLRLIAGLEKPDRGEIFLNRQMVSSSARFVAPEQRNIGYVPQDYGLFPHLTVAENVGFGVASNLRRQRVELLLVRVGLQACAQAYPHQLSGGQQQRVALARALAPNPQMLLLDEPFSGLDLRTRAEVRDATLHLVQKNQISCLMVSHDPTEALLFAERLLVIAEGRLIQEGDPLTLYRFPKGRHVAELFGEVNTLCLRLQDANQDRGLALPFLHAEWIGSLALSLHLINHAIVCQQRYPHDLPPILNPKAPFFVLVRPESIRVVPAHTADSQLPRFIVTSQREVGDRLFLHLASREWHIHAVVNKSDFYPNQTPFVLSVNPNDVLIFPCHDEAEFFAHNAENMLPSLESC